MSKHMFLTNEEINEEAKKYKGFDYSEIYPDLGINDHWDTDEEPSYIEFEQKLDKEAKDIMQKALGDLCGLDPKRHALPEETRKVLLTCRAYVRAVAKRNGYFSYLHPLWKGLDQIESDEAFLPMFITLFPYIWD